MEKGSIDWEYTEDRSFVLRFKPSSFGFINEETRRHARAARKEMLLTLRSIIDGAIKHAEDKENRSRQHREKIEVE